jgi:hypothetical protein
MLKFKHFADNVQIIQRTKLRFTVSLHLWPVANKNDTLDADGFEYHILIC